MSARRPRVIAVLLGAGVGLVLLWSLVGAFLTGPVVLRAAAVKPIEVEPSPERLHATVERLCGVLAPRDWRHPANLVRAAGFIAAELEAAGFDTTIEPYRTSAGTFHNVVARRPGTDPEAGVRLVGAHYDAVEGTPGANDNASGVAVLLELARWLGTRPPARHDQWLVAFGTEEPPFFGTDEMGSHAVARELAASDVRVDLMVALDLVGAFSDEPGSQRLPSPLLRPFYPSTGNFIAVVGDARSGPSIEQVKRAMKGTGALPVHSFRAPARLVPSVTFSDHLSFRRHELPAVLVTDTAFMRYTAYHTAADTPDRLDYERMAALVIALIAVVEH